MKNQYLTTACLALAIAGSASAANIIWQSPQAISASTDVNTQGTLVTGKSTTETTITVNGVTFVHFPLNFSHNFGTGAAVFMGTTTFIGGDDFEGQEYAALMKSAWGPVNWGNSERTFTFSNLTVDQDYLVQFWVADYRTYPGTEAARYLTLTGGANTSSDLAFADSDGPIHGSYVIGTFTADADSQTFAVASGDTVQMNAVQLRAVPEPSALLFGTMGLLASGLLLRRRTTLPR